MSKASVYSRKNTIHIDVLERRNELACVYDLKTGKRHMTTARMHEIADNVYRAYPDTRHIIVMEVRSRE
jgi:hypothetical protein